MPRKWRDMQRGKQTLGKSEDLAWLLRQEYAGRFARHREVVLRAVVDDAYAWRGRQDLARFVDAHRAFEFDRHGDRVRAQHGLYRESSVMLVPVPLAHSKQYKLLESLAVGLPSVVSRVSASVSGIEDRHQALLGETPDEYAEAICQLLANDALAAELSRAGRAFIEAEHTWDSKRDVVARLLEPRA